MKLPSPPDDTAAAAAIPAAPEVAEVGQPTDDVPQLASLPRGSINMQVWLLALPMLGEQFGTFLVGFVDTWLAGQVSKEAQAAVGVGAYMGWFASLVFSLVGSGAAALVARAFGSGDLKTANRALHQSVLLGLVLGVCVSLAIFLAAPLFAAQLSDTAASRDLMVRYIRIDALGHWAFCLMIIAGGSVRAAGDMRTPMLVMIGVNVVNTVVSAALVFGWLGLPQIGVTGIALGTVAARVLGGVAMLAVLLPGLRGLRLRAALWRPDREMIHRILRIGLPAAADAGIMWFAHLAFIKAVVASAQGEIATAQLAAHSIAIRMEAISFLPAVAWMTAAATMVGQYLGAGRPDLAERAGHRAALQGAALTTLIGLNFYFFADWIYGVMTHDPLVQGIGAPAFRVLAFIQPLLGLAIVYIGALRGAGDTRAMLVLQLIGGLMLRVPGAYFFGVYLGWGLIGCWCGMWLDNIAKFLGGWLRFRSGAWKRIKV